MTGQVIPFQSYRNREQAAPCHAPPHHRLNDRSRPLRNPSAGRTTRILKLQIARVAQLLDELEEVARTSDNFPPAIVRQTHTGVERARRILQPFSGSKRDVGRDNEVEGDPQPHVDEEMLERMYRSLNPDP